ncbi:hypothetical protein LTR27_002258 [Elasticomyces elasticus]|nr:hypothetical protein LTR27_002258 [Elasticomyces elasticus]
MSNRSRETGGAGRASKRSKAGHTTYRSEFVFKHQPTVGGLLLTLPAELRNAIYELVLPQDTVIEVDHNTKAPPLLQVCREVRSETVAMWYLGNTFRHIMKHCNGELFERWVMHCENHLDPQISELINHRTSLKGKPNWSALMKWCKVVCEDPTAHTLHRTAGQSRLATVVTAALDTARNCQMLGVPWLGCEGMLDAMRYALGRYDTRWLA